GEMIPFRMIPMKADAPYHSMLMKAYQSLLWEVFSDITLYPPSIDLWSSVTAAKVHTLEQIRQNIHHQFVSPILWTQVIEKMEMDGVEAVINIGPQQIMRHFIKESDTRMASYAFDDDDDKKALLQMGT